MGTGQNLAGGVTASKDFVKAGNGPPSRAQSARPLRPRSRPPRLVPTCRSGGVRGGVFASQATTKNTTTTRPATGTNAGARGGDTNSCLHSRPPDPASRGRDAPCEQLRRPPPRAGTSPADPHGGFGPGRYAAADRLHTGRDAPQTLCDCGSATYGRGTGAAPGARPAACVPSRPWRGGWRRGWRPPRRGVVNTLSTLALISRVDCNGGPAREVARGVARGIAPGGSRADILPRARARTVPSPAPG